MPNGMFITFRLAHYLSQIYACFQLVPTTSIGSRRTMMLQEHSGMDLLTSHQIAVPPYGLARTADEAFEQAKHIGLLVERCFQIEHPLVLLV